MKEERESIEGLMLMAASGQTGQPDEPRKLRRNATVARTPAHACQLTRRNVCMWAKQEVAGCMLQGAIACVPAQAKGPRSKKQARPTARA